ncbi:hypothetical protein HGA88_02865, partial [Candidatus Roizmanbacteria bacterium]|nr:hypothetical protein [Candidatus Roizmanbacteria bacterium]
DNFAGGKIITVGNGRAEIRLQQTHASMRTLGDILRAWKADGFQHELEYYMADSLLRPAAIHAPREAGYMYDILKARYQFFKNEKWEKEIISYDIATSLLHMKAQPTREKFIGEPAIRLFTPQEVAEAFSGCKMPTEAKPLRALELLSTEQATEISVELSKQLLEIKKWYGGEEMQSRAQFNTDGSIQLNNGDPVYKDELVKVGFLGGLEAFVNDAKAVGIC